MTDSLFNTPRQQHEGIDYIDRSLRYRLQQWSYGGDCRRGIEIVQGIPTVCAGPYLHREVWL